MYEPELNPEPQKSTYHRFNEKYAGDHPIATTIVCSFVGTLLALAVWDRVKNK